MSARVVAIHCCGTKAPALRIVTFIIHLQTFPIATTMQPAFVSFVAVGASSSAWRRCHVHQILKTPLRSGRIATVTRSSRRFVQRAGVSMNHSDYDEDDGGDGYFGSINDVDRSLGVPMPAMDEGEREFVDAASSNVERLERLKEIARKRYNEMLKAKQASRDADGKTHGANSAIDYMVSLSRTSQPMDNAKVAADAGEYFDITEARRQGMNAGERYIYDLARKQESAPSGSRDDDRTTVESATSATPNPLQDLSSYVSGSASLSSTDNSIISKSVARMDVIKRQLRDIMENDIQDGSMESFQSPTAVDNVKQLSVDSSSSPRKETDDTEVLDKQISFLEKYLARIKAEDAASLAETETTDLPGPLHPVPSFAESGVTKEDKKSYQVGSGTPADTSDLIKTIQAALGRNDLADPLAAPLPERREDAGGAMQGAGWGDGPGEMTAEEIQAQYEVVRQQSAELSRRGSDKSPPSPQIGETEQSARLAAIALRMEHARFIEKARKALEEYDAKVCDIFDRYTPDLM